jgi:hypothetical protein
VLTVVPTRIVACVTPGFAAITVIAIVIVAAGVFVAAISILGPLGRTFVLALWLG